MGLLHWLFGPKRVTPPPQPFPLEQPLPPRRAKPARTKSFTLKEATFDPDGDQTDLEWRGFHIYDESGAAVSYADARAVGLHIFNVAGVSYRQDVLQRASFAPGSVLRLVPEPNNAHDRDAISVWDADRSAMIGYVPKAINRTIREALERPGCNALAIAEHTKDGRRVSLTVMCGALNQTNSN